MIIKRSMWIITSLRLPHVLRKTERAKRTNHGARVHEWVMAGQVNTEGDGEDVSHGGNGLPGTFSPHAH